MKVLDHSSILSTLAKALGKTCMYVRYHDNGVSYVELAKAATWIKVNKNGAAIDDNTSQSGNHYLRL